MYIFPQHDGQVSIHYQPELLTSDEKAKGFEVASIPDPETPAGKRAILKWDGAELYYEYVDDPSQIDLVQLRSDVDQLIIDALGV